jgi:RNA polymerase sigma-54 factor
MRLDQQPQLTQGQRLVMTPQLRQAVAILQYSALELTQFLQEQTLENPLLEIDPVVLDGEEPERPLTEPAPEEMDVSAGVPDPNDLERWLDYFPDSSDLGLGGPPSSADLPDIIEMLAAEGPDLAVHLRTQLDYSQLPASLAKATSTIIDALDPDGYLRVDLTELAAVSAVGHGDLTSALAVVQRLDPPGVAARDLAECLSLQLQRIVPSPDLAHELVANHLEAVASSRARHLAQVTGRTVADVETAIALIRRLNPRPGSAFASGAATRYIVPDVVVEHVGDQYVVLLNDAATPRLGISPYYRRLVASGDGLAPAAATFLSDRLRSALWVMRCVEQRRSTLYRVVQVIVERQGEFFAHGVRHLRPMTLKDVARAIGVHESTVSRAVANKYVQTPQGAFELRYFFASAIAGAGVAAGDEVASTSVKQVIRELIDAEDPRDPHSDQRLTELLRRRGADLARRTVTKYRRELGVPSSAQRRRPSGR